MGDNISMVGTGEVDGDYVDEAEEEPEAADLRDGESWTTAQLAALTRCVYNSVFLLRSYCNLSPCSSRRWTGKRRRDDQRTRRDRNRAMHGAWEQQIDDLTAAFLRWKHLRRESADPPAAAQDGFDVIAVYTHGTSSSHPLI